MSANSTKLPLNIECFMEDKDVSGRLGRASLEEMAEALLQKCEQTMAAVLDFASKSAFLCEPSFFSRFFFVAYKMFKAFPSSAHD